MGKYLSGNKNSFDKYLYVGNKKFYARVIGTKVPEDAYNERIQKATKKGQQRSDEKKALLYWNLMITNVTDNQCTLEQSVLLYRLRWQIELLFRTLKSTLSLDKMHVGKKDYIEALLYGRLIWTLLTNAFYTTLNRNVFKMRGIEVSGQKFYKLMNSKLHKIYTYTGWDIISINKLGEELLKIAEKCVYQKRERKTTME